MPKDKPKWSIWATSSSFYPVHINKAYGINERENWTSMVFSYSQLSNRVGLNEIQQWFSNYDGFGIALNPLTSLSSAQIGGTNHLPDSVYVYWTSMHDLKFYTTKFTLSDKMKSIMLTQKKVMLKTKYISCYMNDFVFGLLPNGNVKVWLYGCGNYIYITELSPFKVMPQDYDGRKASELITAPQYFKTIEKQANDLGETLSPIPWEKVNKVYTRDNYPVYSIDDYNDQGELINPRVEPVKPEPSKPSYRCWDDKPPVPDRAIKLDKSSPQYALQRLLWNYSPDLIRQIPASDSTLNDAWNEAIRKGLDEDHTQTWVLARLVALSDYPLDKLYKELKVTEKGQKSIKQYVDEMCL